MVVLTVLYFNLLSGCTCVAWFPNCVFLVPKVIGNTFMCLFMWPGLALLRTSLIFVPPRALGVMGPWRGVYGLLGKKAQIQNLYLGFL